MKNLKTYRDLSDYIEVLDDLFMIYLKSDECDNDTKEDRGKIADCIQELKGELLKQPAGLEIMN